MSPRSLAFALDFLTRARGAQRGRRRQKPRGRGTKAVAPLGGERLEPRLALAVNFASGLPADMTASADMFIGDHSVSNSEIWRGNVAGTSLTAPGYGLVLREQGTFARGASYPITVDWLASNRAAGPDYDYRAWIDRSANPAWTSGSPTPSSQDFFVTDPGQLLQRRWFGSDVNATLGKTAEVHFPGIDLDVDSDNSGYVDGSQSEDALELVSTAGVNVPVSTSSLAGLTPLVLGMSDNLRRAGTAAEVSFTFSTTAPTAFRLWQDAARTLPLPWGTAVTAAQLGLGFGGRLNLQLEAVAPTTSFAAITTTALVTGGSWQGTLQDTVRARGVPGVDLDVDSDNDGTLMRSLLEDREEDAGVANGSTTPTTPGLIVPVGPGRVKMIADVPQGRTASLAITQGAGKVRLWTAQTGGTAIPAAGSTVVGGSPQTFWIEAFAASASMADIAFTLTAAGTGPASSDTIRATAVEVDLDVDSNNDDRLDTPKRDADEETKEPTAPKKLVVNDNDTDGDHVPDYADWGITGKRFTPLVLEIPAGLPLGMMQIHVSYAASDPTWVGADHGLPANSGTRPLRIWTKNASQQRNPASVTAGGSFVPEGRIEDLTTLGLTDSIRTVELYVEGIQTTAGVSKPISVQLIVGGRLMSTDLVTVVVVSNTLVIGIDGTGSDAWLSREVNGVRINERNTPDGTRWNSHVRNVVADSWPFAMTIYSHGPANQETGSDSDDIFRAVRDEARNMITDAGGGATIAIVGWSRGAMIGLGVADALLTLAATDLPRTVAFVGLYDPVDMSAWIDDQWARVHRDVKAITIVGPTADRQTEDAFNVDYDVQDGGWNNPHFVRMARGNRITTAAGATTALKIIPYNASHGALGGTPGYNRRHRDGGDFPLNYNYALDVDNSILADEDIRAGMRAAGLSFVPDRDDAWYEFPAQRPPETHRE